MLTFSGDLWAIGEEDSFSVQEAVSVEAADETAAINEIVDRAWDVRLEMTGFSPEVRDLEASEE